MDVNSIEDKLCKGVDDEADDFRKVEKVLAPFLRTLKKRKRVKADVIPEEYKELYLKRHPKDLLPELHNAFVDPVGIKTLLNETAELLKVATNSTSVNFYLVDDDRETILLCPTTMESIERFERRYAIGTYVAAHVAFTKEYVISSDILGDLRFPQGIPEVATAKAVICVPVTTSDGKECLGIIELYRNCSAGVYDLVNLQVCIALTAWMGIAIEQNQKRTVLLKEMELQRRLSLLAESYFSGVISFNKVLSDILEITKRAVRAEKGIFYVFREPVPLHSEEPLLADTYEEDKDENNSTVVYKKRNRTRFLNNEPGLAGYSARSGEVVNVHNAYRDHRFNRNADPPYFRTRSVVAIPIKNDLGVLAVLLLVNNLDFPYFRKEEVDSICSCLTQVSLICGHFLLDNAYSIMQLKFLETHKLLDFHTKPSLDEVASFKAFLQSEQSLPDGFLSFDWDASNYEEEALKIIGYACATFDVLNSCFEFQNLVDFLIRVRKAYRPVTYHNFEHAFYVFHCAFNIIIRIKDIFSTVEILTVLLAALCHDVDHEGLTDNFISLKNDTIYKLYGEVCGEAHRYEVCLFLIQSTDLLSNVSAKNYDFICKNLKKLMLGFDLAIHFQNRIKLTELLSANSFDWDNLEHRQLSQNMILICSDFSAAFKPFEVARKIMANFFNELYKQGDLEKSMGFSPLPFMDRNKIDAITENGLTLLTVVCIPCVELVVTLFPSAAEMEELLKTTMSKWGEVMALRGQDMWNLNQALPKEKRDRKSHRVTLTSTLSSIKTAISNTKSDK